MKKITLLIFLMTISFGYSQNLKLGFEIGESGGPSGVFGNMAAPVYETGTGTNTSRVLKIVTNTAGEVWQGSNFILTTPITLTTNKTMTIDVLASGPMFFLVKVNGGAAEAAAVVSYTGTNTWQTCSFTFNSVRDGKAAAANGTYNSFVIHPYWDSAVQVNFGTAKPTRTLYVDNISEPIVAPALTTTAATAVGNTLGTLNGNISSNGGSDITSYGFYWSTTAGFANGAGTLVEKGTANFTGDISHALTGLTNGTTYYYKAYATNGIGTTYGAQQSFTPIQVLTGNLYINDGTFAAGDFCTAAGQDIAGNDGTPAKPFLTLAYALSRSVQAPSDFIYIDAGTYTWPATHTFTTSGTLANPITIQGKGSATNITSTTATNSGLYFTTGNHWVVKDLKWTATAARTVWVEGVTGITLDNCTFVYTNNSNTLQSIIINNAAGKLTVKNCMLTRTNTAFHMIEIVAGASLTMLDNTVSFSALVPSGTASSVKITPNASSIFIIERNKFINGGYGIHFNTGVPAVAANASSIIKNNFFKSYWGLINQSITGLKVYHNSFYTNGECIYGISVGFLTNWDIQNNILYTYGTSKACILSQSATSHPAIMNYNHYYSPSTGAGQQTGAVLSFTAWQNAAGGPWEANGQGGNATANNPLFVNIAAGDLHLLAGSPAIGVGSNVGVTDDIDGNTRPLSGTFDIGADEFNSGAPTITNFPAIAKVMGDAPFTLTQPTSNSNGTWTYSIVSGTAATISGTTVTLVAPGTATIRATQAADGPYSSGFIDAILSVATPSSPPSGPIEPPVRNTWDVLSVYSDSYVNQAGVNFLDFGGSVINADFTPTGGTPAKYYTNHSFSGIQVNTGGNLNVSQMTHLHFDVWSPNFNSMRLKLESSTGTARELDVTGAIVPSSSTRGQWISVDLALSTYDTGNILTSLKYIVPVTFGQNATLYIDNVYFYRPATTQPPTLGAFTVPAQLVGNPVFTLTPPTSTSMGAFSYNSSDTAVATIVNGNQINVVGVGTSTITAIQAADGPYGSASTTATLTVTPTAAPTPPNRNAFDVISYYSDSYSTASSPTWGGTSNNDISISGNTTRIYSAGFTNGQIAFANNNVSQMTHVHIDVFSVNLTPMWFFLNSKRITLNTPVNGWTSLDIPLTDFTSSPTGAAIDLNSINLFRIENPVGATDPPRIIYVDNVYFFKEPTTYITSWSNGVPTSTVDAVIDGNYNIATSITCKDLTINAGKTLTIGAGNTLTVTGNLNNNGSIVFKSDATSTAIFSQFLGTITGSGNVTVERYIPAKRVWRALTAPLKGSTNNSLNATWQNGEVVTANTGVEIWGPAGTGMATGPNYSVLNYTPTGWASVTNTNTANLFDATRNNAYLVFVTGGYGSGNIASTIPATATTLKATGQLITGDVTYTSIIDTKHTLIGNPYASPLIPSTLLAGATNLLDFFWVYDSAIGSAGGYVSYDKVLGTYTSNTSYPTNTTAIQSGQAFFVRATTGNAGSFTISESKKSTLVSNVFGKNANLNLNNSVNASILRVGMFKEESNQEWNPLDGAIAGFYSTANNLVDDNDGKKFANGSENIAFVRNNTTLSSEHFATPQPLDELYMRVWNTSVNNYKLRINTESFTVPNVEATLIDLFTGVQTPINLDGTVQEYPFAVTSATASTGDRFKVVFSASPLATTIFDTKSVKVYPNPVTNGIVNVQLPEGDYTNYSYELVNVLGQTVMSDTIETLSGNQFSFNTRGLANTWYALRILNKGKAVYQTKVIIAN